MKYSRKKFAQAVVKLLATHPRKYVVQAVAAEIVAMKWTNQLDLLMHAITEELLTAQQHLEISLVSGRKLSRARVKEIAASLQTRLQARTVAVTENIDPSLIGGFIARTPRGELNASVHSSLNQLTH